MRAAGALLDTEGLKGEEEEEKEREGEGGGCTELPLRPAEGVNCWETAIFA